MRRLGQEPGDRHLNAPVGVRFQGIQVEQMEAGCQGAVRELLGILPPGRFAVAEKRQRPPQQAGARQLRQKALDGIGIVDVPESFQHFSRRAREACQRGSSPLPHLKVGVLHGAEDGVQGLHRSETGERGNRPEAHEPDFILGGGDEQRSSARVGAASEGTGHLGADFRVGMEGQRMKRVIGSGTRRFGEGARSKGAHFLAVVPSQTQEFLGVFDARQGRVKPNIGIWGGGSGPGSPPPQRSRNRRMADPAAGAAIMPSERKASEASIGQESSRAQSRAGRAAGGAQLPEHGDRFQAVPTRSLPRPANPFAQQAGPLRQTEQPAAVGRFGGLPAADEDGFEHLARGRGAQFVKPRGLPG